MHRFLTAALAVLLSALPASAGPLQEAALEFARAQPREGFAFTRTVNAEGRDKKGKVERRVIVDRFDPSKPADRRWTLVSIDGRAPTAKELKEAAKRYREDPVPSYARVADWLGQTATETGRELRFASFAEDTFGGGRFDLSKKLRGTATLDEANGKMWVETASFSLAKPTRIMLIGKLERMTITTRYRLLPSGIPVIDTQTVDMAGSGLGRSGSQRSVTRFSDYRRVG